VPLPNIDIPQVIVVSPIIQFPPEEASTIWKLHSARLLTRTFAEDAKKMTD
jgi:hypothetical protein